MEDKNKYEINLKTKEPNNEDKWHKRIKTICTVFATVGTLAGLGTVGYKTWVTIDQWQNQEQSQQQNQSQKQEQDQTQIVIDPREGDVIVYDGKNYKLIQLLNNSDVSFPNGVQERQFSKANSKEEKRVYVNRDDSKGWENADSFMYTIDYFSLNANKVFNLLDYIQNINLYLDFYEEQDVTTIIKFADQKNYFQKDIWSNSLENTFRVSFHNLTNGLEYVTNRGSLHDDGINFMKARLEVVYNINDKKVSDTLLSDWLDIHSDPYAGK